MSPTSVPSSSSSPSSSPSSSELFFLLRAPDAEAPVASVLLRHTQGNVLFDTGCHPDVATDPEGRLGTLAKYMQPIMPADDHVLTSLKAVGLGPDDIDVVICSHLHTDHCGCNAFFKKATVFVHALEIEAAKAYEHAAGYEVDGAKCKALMARATELREGSGSADDGGTTQGAGGAFEKGDIV